MFKGNTFLGHVRVTISFIVSDPYLYVIINSQAERSTTKALQTRIISVLA
jgi:hypothetical protein